MKLLGFINGRVESLVTLAMKPEEQSHPAKRLRAPIERYRRSTVKKHQVSFGLCVGFMVILVLGIVPTTMAADPSPVVGNWEGTLDPGAQPKKRILVHITAAQDGSLSGTIDYPDDSASGALITAITYKEPVLHFESASGQVSYDGTMSKENSEIAGTWKQGAAALSLTLKKSP